MRRHGNHRRKILLVMLAGLVLLPAVIGGALRPRLVVYAENYVQYQATSKMERAVADCAGQMEEIGKLHQDDSGAVTALTTNAAAVNRIRTQLVQRVYDEIGELEQAQTSVALGTLGCVTAQVESHFSSAGINQTLYEVSVTVSADFSLQLLGAAKSITVRANYPLEETILVGDVPMISSNSK